MDWQSASAVKVRLIVQFLKYLRVEHTDNKVIRFVTIRDYTKQCLSLIHISQPLENLKTLIIAVIGAVGVIILAKNVMEFAQAYQQQDSSTMNSALKGIVAGVMMAGISTVLTFLGF